MMDRREPRRENKGEGTTLPQRKSSGAPQVPTIRAVSVQRLLERIDKDDEKVAALLARHEVALAGLLDPYAIMPLAHYVALLEDAADLLDAPHLGAEMGSCFRPADIGPTGLLFSLSGTLGDAFARMGRYLPAFQTSTSSGLLNAGEHMLWAYRIHDPRIWPRRQDAEYAVMATCELIRSCLTTPWWPIEVHFEHAAPADPGPLRRLFRAPILFDQPTNGLLLAKQDVERINRVEDRDLLHVLERHVTELLQVHLAEDSYAGRVEWLIAMYLDKRPITLEGIAAALGLPARSLQRRLAEEGTSLRQLLRDHRTRLADARLGDEGRGNVAGLAQALGYSERSVLSRAYRNWTGRSLVRGRKVVRGG
ncbi:AraC family transcriptional regulator [Sphingobium sp. Cam5-1]|uniref:AraC family transcriptional regulator n=1 Tax=Sphingobium sp. Cam5-1 TaxID=2789327 RepID=UPI0018AD1ECF|nr:AraC family transcriptional regulator [Sphingobium sp. Cam5-1]QPI74559.1 AraC family transcriptional regulator [Sphingobium sp. Cam5-1]